MTAFEDTPIPCPYTIGAKFQLQVSPPDGVPYEAQITVTDVFTPFTHSSVMKVNLDPQGFSRSELNLPSELVFKVYDRRFAHELRELYEAKPPTYESELAYHQYVRSGNAPNGLDEITEERNANYDGRVPDRPELLEHGVAAYLEEYIEDECAAYTRLSSLQGHCIPRFYGTCFLHTPGLSMDGVDLTVSGILLEFIPGVNLDKVDPASVDLDCLFHSALDIIEKYSALDVLNTDVRLGNFIVKPDGTGVVLVDFSHSRLREQTETDEEWKSAKSDWDEAGDIRSDAKATFKWNYVPTYKHLVLTENV